MHELQEWKPSGTDQVRDLFSGFDKVQVNPSMQTFQEYTDAKEEEIGTGAEALQNLFLGHGAKEQKAKSSGMARDRVNGQQSYEPVDVNAWVHDDNKTYKSKSIHRPTSIDTLQIEQRKPASHDTGFATGYQQEVPTYEDSLQARGNMKYLQASGHSSDGVGLKQIGTVHHGTKPKLLTHQES